MPISQRYLLWHSQIVQFSKQFLVIAHMARGSRISIQFYLDRGDYHSIWLSSIFRSRIFAECFDNPSLACSGSAFSFYVTCLSGISPAVLDLPLAESAFRVTSYADPFEILCFI